MTFELLLTSWQSAVNNKSNNNSNNNNNIDDDNHSHNDDDDDDDDKNNKNLINQNFKNLQNFDWSLLYQCAILATLHT